MAFKIDTGIGSRLGGVVLQQRKNDDILGVAFQTARSAAPDSANDYLLYRRGTTLYFWNGTTETALGGAGGGGTPTWETIFAADATFTMTPDNTFTIAGNRATATDVVTITNIAGGSGSCLQITNSGSGNDIDGTSNTWGVTALGVATFTGLTLSGANTITTTGGDITWTLEDNDSTALIIGASGDTNMMTFDTSNAAPVVRFGDGMAVTDGLASFGSTSNTVANITVTNNTITTFGAAANAAGAVVIASTSLTTGSLLKLELSDTSNAGGFYLACRDTIGGTNDFTIGENGVVVALGTAGSNSFTLSNGDMVLSDGSITITDADNAATLSITNDTVSTLGAAADTGLVHITSESVSTGVLLNLSADETNLTSGFYLRCYGQDAAAGVFTVGEFGATVITDTNATATPLTITANSATTVTGGLVAIAANALSTGIGILVSSTSLDITSGQLLNLDHTASGTLSAAKTGQLVDVVSSRTHTAATAISDDYDGISMIRTSIVNNAGGTLNAAGSCLYVENVSTQTAGTMADTANGIEVVMTGGAESQGYGLSITHTGTSVGRAISIAASQTTSTVMLMTANDLTTTGVGLSIGNTGTGLTSGSLLRVSTGTTGAVATNGIVSIRATGAYTSTSNVGLLDVLASATTAGTVVRIAASAAGQTATELLRVEASGYTTGYTGNVANFVGVSTTGASNVVAISSANSTAGNALSVTANSLTTGTAVLVTSSGTITSAGEGLVNLVGSGITSGSALKIDLTEATLASGLYINCYDDTAAGSVFTIGEDGLLTITGAAGSNMLVVTAGDVSIADGSIVLADNDNAITVGITNDTASTVGAAADSGVVTISADGLTTGTALNIGLTEGTLTTGRYLKCWDVTGGVEVAAIEEDGELFVAGGRATTAGGADAINIGASAAIKIAWGSGPPTYTAPQGSLYLRTDGSSTTTRAYINTDGAGTWTNLTSAA